MGEFGRTIIIGIILTAGVVLLARFLSGYWGGPTTMTENPLEKNNEQEENGTETGKEMQVPANALLVSIKNIAFNPQSITVKKGTTIIWKNDDDVAHDVNSDFFKSEEISPGETFQTVFNDSGIYEYMCSKHPEMRGQIIVQE